MGKIKEVEEIEGTRRNKNAYPVYPQDRRCP